MTFPWLSMTKLAIFHDHFRGQDSGNFSWEINFWKISETLISVTIFWMQIRVKLVIFHDHIKGWDSSKFFTSISSLDNFGNYDIRDHTSNANRVKFSLLYDFWYFLDFSMTANFSMTFPNFPWQWEPWCWTSHQQLDELFRLNGNLNVWSESFW